MNDYGILINAAEKYGAAVLMNEPMKSHTSFCIGGPCDIMIKINCEALLCELIKLCSENSVKYYIVGRGSNILVSDEGLRGAVLLIGKDFGSVRVKGDIIECEAGASLAAVCNVALENSLTGLEFAYGIPGSVGGAVFMNAGAYGGEMKDVLLSCRYIDENGKIKELPLEKMELSYRHSFFSERELCITSVKMRLQKGE
ncbi:MAG: FAD-binding protein, partial [Ruminiclostridium sp.]|nr:FAD-binding protein [Ruminiclostridium sp.]